jgi:hypothetical protein
MCGRTGSRIGRALCLRLTSSCTCMERWSRGQGARWGTLRPAQLRLRMRSNLSGPRVHALAGKVNEARARQVARERGPGPRLSSRPSDIASIESGSDRRTWEISGSDGWRGFDHTRLPRQPGSRFFHQRLRLRAIVFREFQMFFRSAHVSWHFRGRCAGEVAVVRNTIVRAAAISLTF